MLFCLFDRSRTSQLSLFLTVQPGFKFSGHIDHILLGTDMCDDGMRFDQQASCTSWQQDRLSNNLSVCINKHMSSISSLHCYTAQLLKTVFYLALWDDLCSMKDRASHQQK